MFTGPSAFPLTPMDEHGIDEGALTGLVGRLGEAGVDSIGALGSTGSYACSWQCSARPHVSA